jgi:cobalamin synthase
LLKQAFAALNTAGFAMDATLIDRLAQTMWGAFVAVLVLANLSAVLLARWWQSLLHQPGAFGREFRDLRSGVVLGTLLIVIAVSALWLTFAWLDSMAWVAMMGLALQGLAAAHRRKAEGHLQRGWLVAIYVMLIVPLFSFITVALLAGWGLADFWRRMRISAA